MPSVFTSRPTCFFMTATPGLRIIVAPDDHKDPAVIIETAGHQVLRHPRSPAGQLVLPE